MRSLERLRSWSRSRRAAGERSLLVKYNVWETFYKGNSQWKENFVVQPVHASKKPEHASSKTPFLPAAAISVTSVSTSVAVTTGVSVPGGAASAIAITAVVAAIAASVTATVPVAAAIVPAIATEVSAVVATVSGAVAATTIAVSSTVVVSTVVASEASAVAPTAAAVATSSTTSALACGHLHTDGATVDLDSRNTLHSVLGILGVLHGHESETTRASGASVS